MSPKSKSPQGRKGPKDSKSSQKPWWTRPVVWVGSIASALVIAIATGYGTGVGQGLFSAIVHHKAPQQEPLKINQEIRNNQVAYDTRNAQAWALPYLLNPASSAAHILIPPNAGSGYETPDSYIDRFDSWLFTHGGATVGVTNLVLTLIGGQGTTVVQSICAHIIKRTKIMSGTLFFKPPQGVGVPVETALDLDSAEPCARYFQEHYISLSQGQSAVVDVSVVAHSDTVSWNLFIDAIVNGKQKFIPVDSTQVLRTTGLLPNLARYGVFYEDTNPDGYSEVFRPTVPGPSDNQQVDALAG